MLSSGAPGPVVSGAYASMRIVQLIDSLTVGGAEKLQVLFARAARERGVEVTIVGLKPPRYPEIFRELAALDARLVTLGSASLSDPRQLVSLVRLLRRERFDVLFTHLSTANILGPIAAALAGTPAISTLHSEAPPPNRVRGALESWTLRRLSRRVVAVGRAVAEAHQERLGGRRPIEIPNPVAPIPLLAEAERCSIRRELAGDGKDFILMSTGMLRRQKAFDDLLTAFAELRLTHPGAALVIAGGGPQAGELAAQIEASGLAGHAHLLGVRGDVPRLLAAVDVYVSSSLWEGLPLSVLEGMAAGLPVVATAVGDLPQVVAEGTGLLVEPGRPRALAEALRSVLDDRAGAVAMGAAARRHVARNYGPDRWADRLLELAREVACGGGRRSERRGGPG